MIFDRFPFDQRRGFGWRVVTLGAVTMAIGGNRALFADDVAIPLLWIGFGLVCVAGLALATSFESLDEPVGERLDPRMATRKELPAIYKFSGKFLPELPPLRAAKEVFQVNPRTLWIVERTRTYRWGSTQVTVVGFFSMLPVTEAARQLIHDEELQGLQFTKAHITVPDATPAAIYVGSIGASGLKAKAETVALMRGRIQAEVERGIRNVYTRPVSADGLRLAKKYGFVPVGEDCGGSELKRVYLRVFDAQA